MDTIDLIRKERTKQISKGYTLQHDLEPVNNDSNILIQGALAYIMADSHLWPWDEYDFDDKCGACAQSTYKGRIKCLTKAAALICAEIDRLKYLDNIEEHKKAMAL